LVVPLITPGLGDGKGVVFKISCWGARKRGTFKRFLENRQINKLYRGYVRLT